MPETYIPYTITAYANRAILVRTAINPLSLIKNVRAEIWSVDRNVAFTKAGTLTDLLQRYSYDQPRFGLISISAFAAIGLLLAAIGIFSVMAYAVSLEIHEIGIRMALGAQRNDILKMVLRSGLALVGTGILIGLALSLAVTRLLSSEIWGRLPQRSLDIFRRHLCRIRSWHCRFLLTGPPGYRSEPAHRVAARITTASEEIGPRSDHRNVWRNSPISCITGQAPALACRVALRA